MVNSLTPGKMKRYGCPTDDAMWKGVSILGKGLFTLTIFSVCTFEFDP